MNSGNFLPGHGSRGAIADVFERFWQISPEPMSGCWLWDGAHHGRGYGRVTINYRTRSAHRAVYEMVRGPIPEGMELDHKCRLTCCVNPDHLEPITHRENVVRGDAPAKLALLNGSKTHCKRGHPFDEENTHYVPGGRSCRACAAAAARQKRANRRNG